MRKQCRLGVVREATQEVASFIFEQECRVRGGGGGRDEKVNLFFSRCLRFDREAHSLASFFTTGMLPKRNWARNLLGTIE